MKQLDLWQRERSRRMRDVGTSKVEAHNQTFVDQMRQYAVWYCEQHGRVTSDDLRRYADRLGIVPEHVNAWGAVFRDSRFEQIGTQTSDIPSRRAGLIRVWGLTK